MSNGNWELIQQTNNLPKGLTILDAIAAGLSGAKGNSSLYATFHKVRSYSAKYDAKPRVVSVF